MRYWWVSQNQTHKQEIRGGYMWCPKTNRPSSGQPGGRNVNYDMMSTVQPGDVIFSFFGQSIQAIGVALGPAETCPQPDEFVAAGHTWDDDGWKVDVEYRRLKSPLRVRDHFETLKPVLPAVHSPINKNGMGNQVYFTSVPDGMADVLRQLIGHEFDFALAELGQNMRLADVDADAVQSGIEQRLDIGIYEKKQLVKARRGQGIFRNNVQLVEEHCRLTGVDIPHFLIASHIKPWKDAIDAEKIDGENGLLLSPHVDHLFDKGFMSFTDSGRLIISKALQNDYSVMAKWGLDPDANVGTFTARQRQYLEFHRDTRLLPVA